jgi:hypothetical protein
MLHFSVPVMAAWADAGLLILAGLVNLSGLRRVRAVYAAWDIPDLFQYLVGMLQLLAAAFLISPEMRVYGIAIAAPILFGSVVTLLNHRVYSVAAPVAMMMAGLLAATLAVAPVHIRYPAEFAPNSISATMTQPASPATSS